MAGVHRQRLTEVATGTRGVPGIYAMGTAIHCYAKVHGVTDKEAMAVLLYVPAHEDDAEAVAA
jgi:hypothetical protein